MSKRVKGAAATAVQRTYDRIPLGVVRVNRQRKITYANRMMKALIGVDPVGASLTSFVDPNDPDSRTRLENEFRKRIRGQASQYEIELRRPRDGRHVPVSISAAPEFGATGKPVGSLAFVRDLRVERANIEIHRAIERETTMSGLLNAFCREIGKLIPFDTFRITLISEDREHLVILYENPGKFIERTAIKWWPMPPIVREYLKRTEVHNLDVAEWFGHPEAQELARKDSDTRKWLEGGVQHILVRPVLREDKVAAFVAMESRSARPYRPEQLRLCEQVPVSEVVLSVLQIERRRELEFVMDLIREMGEVSDDIGAVARALVDRLQAHYGWEYVSLFQVDEDAGVLRLLKQAGALEVLIKEGYTQALGEGLIGLAYNGGKGRAVNVGNVLDADYDGTYLPGIASTCSEMCLPVPGTRLRWILNVEASQQNAFSEEEQRRVEVVLREAGFTLERAALRGVKLAIMSSIKDAVIQTNDAGIIREINPAAEELFGAEPQVLFGKHFAERVTVGDAHAAVATACDFPRTEVTLKRLDGASFPALLSCARLPPELGGKVFVASDLSFQKRVEQTNLLKDVFSQVAQETRTPLALVSSWLRRAAAGADGDLAELLDKAQRQLRKMDVTLERVLRVASDISDGPARRTTIDLREFLDGVVDELPKADAMRIDRSFDPSLPPVVASAKDLQFCVHNLFGVLMRAGSQEDKLVVAARREAHSAVLEVHHVAHEGAREARERLDYGGPSESLRGEIASGIEVVKDTLQRMGAELSGPDTSHGGFAIYLPIAK